jgi:hypothetical protein
MPKIVRGLVVGFLVLGGIVVASGTSGAGKPSATAPNPCSLITASDIAATLSSHGPTLTPSTVGTPTKSKPTNVGGFGPHACETSFVLPQSISGDVIVLATKQTAGTSCPDKSQPGKKTKLGSTRALIQFTPEPPKEVRNITFPDGKECVSVEITLSSSEAAVPASEFVSLGKAALAKRG